MVLWLDFAKWQWLIAPKWLLQFFWNCERYLLQAFSVPLMIKTLFSYWHRDAVAYRQAGISAILTAWAWNSISRVIGFSIRSVVLVIWLGCTAMLTAVALLFVAGFYIWPLIVAFELIRGLGLIFLS